MLHRHLLARLERRVAQRPQLFRRGAYRFGDHPLNAARSPKPSADDRNRGGRNIECPGYRGQALAFDSQGAFDARMQFVIDHGWHNVETRIG